MKCWHPLSIADESTVFINSTCLQVSRWYYRLKANPGFVWLCVNVPIDSHIYSSREIMITQVGLKGCGGCTCICYIGWKHTPAVKDKMGYLLQ